MSEIGSANMVLEVTNLTKQFAGLTAVDSVTMAVEQGEIIGLIGPNGAGKTTLFNCISGVYQLTGGTVQLNGVDITSLPSHEIAKRGLARTFQITRPLKELTVLENIMVGAHIQTRRRDPAKQIARDALEFVGMTDQANKEAGEVTVGSQKRLELARALVINPQVLLVDEIMAGLTPTESEEMLELFREIKKGGTSILIIEHDMSAIMNISDRVIVLDGGRNIAFGSPEDVANDKEVLKAYLGGVLDA